MSTSELISLAAGVVGTLVTIWVALAGRQLFRPKFVVGIGPPFDRSRDRLSWRRPRASEAIAFGLTSSEAQHVVFPISIHIQNKGDLPISDVDVVLEFSSEALIDKRGIVGPVDGQVVTVSGRFPDDRVVTRFQGLAQSRIPLGMIRPGEVMITGELLQLRSGLIRTIAGSEANERAKRRYSKVEQLRSAVEVRITIWSSSMRPLSLSVVLMWLCVSNEQELLERLKEMVMCSVAENPIEPGTYFVPPLGRRRLYRDQAIDLVMIKAGEIDDLVKAFTIDGMVENDRGGVVLRLPPWGLWGESFDIRSRFRAKLIRKARARHTT